VTEESYTSETRFLDGDPLTVFAAERQGSPIFSGRRVKRGLYRSARGRQINADVNGAYNIIRTAIPDACGKGIAGTAVHPVLLPVRAKPVA
jgi:putative transposase